jgi:hypothetical protein
MKFASLPAIAIAVISIGALAACGQPTPPPSESTAQIWHELVACARAHGDPTLPDPVIDSQGRAQFPPGTQAPSAETQRACQSIYNRLPASDRIPGLGPVDIQMEIKFAQCMRQQGVTDWPDPDVNSDYPLPADLRAPIKTKSGPVWDRIKAAADACKAFNPSGRISDSQH